MKLDVLERLRMARSSKAGRSTTGIDYTSSTINDAINEIERLRGEIAKMKRHNIGFEKMLGGTELCPACGKQTRITTAGCDDIKEPSEDQDT